MMATPDIYPYKATTSYTFGPGFFFAVSGISTQQISYGQALTFHFKNLSGENPLLGYGLLPCFIKVDDSTYHDLTQGKLPFYRQKWVNVNGDTTTRNPSPDNEKLQELNFSIDLNLFEDLKADDHIFISFV